MVVTYQRLSTTFSFFYLEHFPRDGSELDVIITTLVINSVDFLVVWYGCMAAFKLGRSSEFMIAFQTYIHCLVKRDHWLSSLGLNLPWGQSAAVVYAENFHGAFIQWHIVVICIGCAMFVTSQFDVVFMFPNQRLGEVCWHNMHILLHAISLNYVSLHWI